MRKLASATPTVAKQHLFFVGYPRVSSDEQRAGNSIELQTEKIMTWAAQRFDPTFECLDVTAEDFSGFEYERPVMDVLRKAAIDGTIDAIVVSRMDRFARDQGVFILLERFFKKHGVRLFSVEDGEFTPGAINKFLAAIKHAEAESNAETAKLNMRNARHGYINKGTPQSQGVPMYGYDKIGKKGDTRYVVNKAESEVIQVILDLYLRRWPTQKIADHLNDQNHPQPSVSKGVKTGGRQNGWTKHSVRRIVYCIEMYHGVMTGYKHTNAHENVTIDIPPIIDDDIYERVLLVRNEHHTRFYRRVEHDRSYLLIGRMTCTCGYSLAKERVQRWTKSQGYYYYYRCTAGLDKKLRGDCPVKRFDAANADVVVWDFMEKILLDPRAAIARYQAQKRDSQRFVDDALSNLESIDQLIGELTGEREQVMVLFRKRAISEERLDSDLIVIDKQIAKLKSERTKWQEIVEQNTFDDEKILKLERVAAQIRSRIGEGVDDELKQEIFDRLKLHILVERNAEGKIVFWASILGSIPEQIEIREIDTSSDSTLSDGEETARCSVTITKGPRGALTFRIPLDAA